MAKKGGMFAALILGKKKPAMGDEPESMDDVDEYSEVPPDFEDEAVRFMPELEGDSERLMAFWKAVKACMEG